MPIRNPRALGAQDPHGGIADLNDAGGGGGGGVVTFPNDREIAPLHWCVYDAAGLKVADVVAAYQWDEDTGTYLTSDMRTPDGVPYVLPAGHTLGACSTGQSFQIDIHEMCDDINGDGSVIVRYFEAAKIECDAAGLLTRTVTGTYVDDRFTAPYVPISGVECETIGVPVVGLRPERVVLDGAGAWTAPAGEILTSLTIETRTIANAATPPQFTDGAGNVTSLFEGTETVEAEWLAGSGGLTGTPISVTTGAGDRVVILYTVADT